MRAILVFASRRFTICFLTLWLLGFVRPAAAQIAASGPTPLSARTLEFWYDHHIPAHFRARSRVSVRLLTDRQMVAYLHTASASDNSHTSSHAAPEDESDIDGIFENDPPQITLRLPSTGEADPLTFAHEYGHYVWFRLLSREDRRRYEGLYDHQRAAHRLVTHYADAGLEEGFAEAFSFYAAAPQVLQRRDPLSCQFLAQWDAGHPDAR